MQAALKNASREELFHRIESLEARVAWFERQYFGSKSERLIPQDPRQFSLFDVPEEPPTPSTSVKSYERSAREKPTDTSSQNHIRFDDSVPVDVEVVFLRK